MIILITLASFILFCSSCSSIQSAVYASYVDKNGGNQLLENEKYVRMFVEDIIKSPDDYSFSAYKRKFFINQIRRTNFQTHSYYVIEDNKGNLYTLAYYGTEWARFSTGAWTLNSEKDISSHLSYVNGEKNKWGTTRIEIEINSLETAKKIIELMDSGKTYYYRDHVVDKPDFINCNTVIWITLVPKDST